MMTTNAMTSQETLNSLSAIADEIRALDARAASLPCRRLGVMPDLASHVARLSIWAARQALEDAAVRLQNESTLTLADLVVLQANQ